MIDHQLIDIKRGKADRDKGMKLAAWGRADILNEARAMAKRCGDSTKKKPTRTIGSVEIVAHRRCMGSKLMGSGGEEA